MEWFMGKGKKKFVINDVEIKESKPYLDKKVYDSFIIGKEEIKDMISLPDAIDLNEWLATHTLTIFHSTNQIYGAVSEFCTNTSCPNMTAGSVVYNWFGRKGKTSAPQYVDFVMSHIQKHVEDDSCLPSKYGSVFPPTFVVSIKKFLKLLFHVIGHLYYSHIDELVGLQLNSHLNTVFLHLMYFDNEFNLLESRETSPLDDLTQAMELNLDPKPA